MARGRDGRRSAGAGNSLDEIVAAHQRGDLDTAERGYRRILDGAPGHADALNLLAFYLGFSLLDDTVAAAYPAFISSSEMGS